MSLPHGFCFVKCYKAHRTILLAIEQRFHQPSYKSNDISHFRKNSSKASSALCLPNAPKGVLRPSIRTPWLISGPYTLRYFTQCQVCDDDFKHICLPIVSTPRCQLKLIQKFWGHVTTCHYRAVQTFISAVKFLIFQYLLYSDGMLPPKYIYDKKKLNILNTANLRDM